MATLTILDENQKLRIEMEREAAEAVIRPVGIIDEDMNSSVITQAITASPPVQQLTLDLGHVSRMNSCGVREWILLMERLSTHPSCKIVNANELFVEQANMIPGIFGKKGVKVLSFQAPYRCGACARDIVKVLTPEQVPVVDGQPHAPQYTCEKCSKPLEFDWAEDEYFAFVRRLP
ncbi:MAG: hypothetical protein NDJ90_11235 [Oligoflexia bacterium]|nr:hypothetical protein [Oligoflexia bacterium]